MSGELTIKGDIQVLRLKAGDVVVVTLERHVNAEQATWLQEQLKERFPDNEVLLAHGVAFTVQRQDA